MKSWTFYSKHLERVSRSFSFCIAQLKSPQKEWIGLSYLLFRIADTIEDSSWIDQKIQFSQFDIFEQALVSPPSQKTSLMHWIDNFPLDIPDSEKLLLNDTHSLLSDLFSLPIPIRTQIQKNVLEMMKGMRYFLKNHTLNGELVLTNLPLLNQYCFFVAGLVGELLTVFFVKGLNEIESNEQRLVDAFHFGLFLQKVNILKDQLKDESLGRQFISSREQLRASVNQHAFHALSYIKSLPIKEGKTFRVFCAWSLFIGLASLKWIDKSYDNKKNYKISKTETMGIILNLKSIINSNDALDKLFKKYLRLEEYENQKKTLANEKPNAKLPSWFLNIYSSTPLNSHAQELGLIEIG